MPWIAPFVRMSVPSSRLARLLPVFRARIGPLQPPKIPSPPRGGFHVKQHRKPQMKKHLETLLDVATAVAIGLGLAAYLLHSLDALFY